MELKRISPAAIPGALAKADKYRLLNEPEQAESICRDVLAVETGNQTALVTLLLALTDQFAARNEVGVRHAEEALAQLEGDYARAYYAGLVRERWARALLAGGDPGRQALAWLGDAMRQYETAGALAPGGNDDSILRWNACVRTIARERLAESEPLSLVDMGD